MAQPDTHGGRQAGFHWPLIRPSRAARCLMVADAPGLNPGRCQNRCALTREKCFGKIAGLGLMMAMNSRPGHPAYLPLLPDAASAFWILAPGAGFPLAPDRVRHPGLPMYLAGHDSTGW